MIEYKNGFAKFRREEGHIIIKKRLERKPFTLRVVYSLTVKEGSGIKNLRLNGTILNVCASGYCLSTNFPLTKGHTLTILNPEVPDIPKYGVVRWVKKESDSYRAGVRTCGHHREF